MGVTIVASSRPVRSEKRRVPSGKLSLAEMDEHPAGHVLGAGDDAAGRVHVVVLVDGDRRGALLQHGVRDGHVPPGERRVVARPARGHAGALEDALRDEVLPGHAAHGLDDLARGDVEHVVVGVGGAEARRRPDEAKAADDLAPAVGRFRPEQEVARAEPEAAPVDEEVADGHLARHVRVPHLEPGEVARDRAVPLELALLDEEAQGRGREDLGVGGDAEERLRVDRRRLAELADAVALGQDDLAVLDHGDGHARDLEGLHDLGHVGVEAGREDRGRGERGSFGRRGGLGCGLRCRGA